MEFYHLFHLNNTSICGHKPLFLRLIKKRRQMNPDERNIRNKGMHKFRGVAHIAIGLLYITVGGYFGYFKIFGTI